MSGYGLPEYDATILTQSQGHGRLLRAGRTGQRPAQAGVNWLMGEISRRLNADETDGIEAPPISATQLAAMIARIADGTIRNAARAPGVRGAVERRRRSDVDAVIEAKGLKQMNDTGALEKIVDEVMAANPATSRSSRPARTRPSTPWSARSMKASKGKANPAASH